MLEYKRLHSPIGWAGGKGLMTTKIISVLPPHKKYCEPFGGAASVLLAIPPVEVEYYNDIHPGLVNLFNVLKNVHTFNRLYRQLLFTPFSRHVFMLHRDTWQDTSDVIEQAYRFIVQYRMSFAGKGKSFGLAFRTISGDMPSIVEHWCAALLRLPDIHQRLCNTIITNTSWQTCLQQCQWGKEGLWYLDPPYVPTERHGSLYQYEMSVQDHEELIQYIKRAQCKVVLSGYPNKLYDTLINHGWKVYDWTTCCHLSGKTRFTGILGKGSSGQHRQHIERVWYNF